MNTYIWIPVLVVCILLIMLGLRSLRKKIIIRIEREIEMVHTDLDMISHLIERMIKSDTSEEEIIRWKNHYNLALKTEQSLQEEHYQITGSRYRKWRGHLEYDV